ncbi:hypothetical protein D9758_007778 [Tetrapyrgos nigripes]|uniref:DUF6534 domain-containing protein n=1 Tax=Tetrapyrgos nigripes TaxID=182062 RepID=A0A8H5D037_9AGAR|nr:hypothetical protein D9758_007778 [Tetrapyrgos nigripes]
MICDLFVAVALLYNKLFQTDDFAALDKPTNIVDRFTAYFMQTGFFTALLSIASLVIYLSAPLNIDLCLTYTLATLSTSAVMSYLNSRNPTVFVPNSTTRHSRVPSGAVPGALMMQEVGHEQRPITRPMAVTMTRRVSRFKDHPPPRTDDVRSECQPAHKPQSQQNRNVSWTLHKSPKIQKTEVFVDTRVESDRDGLLSVDITDAANYDKCGHRKSVGSFATVSSVMTTDEVMVVDR